MLTESTAFDKAYQKGFLESDMKMFYLHTTSPVHFEYHYHDFYKLLIHIQGNVTYHIEGTAYTLSPYDTLLISPGEIHRPEVGKEGPYERIIAYISEPFFNAAAEYGISLKDCFTYARNHKQHVIRFTHKQKELSPIIAAIKTCYSEEVYGGELLKRLKLQEYLLLLEQKLQNPTHIIAATSTSNEKVTAIMDYITRNLTTNLSIATIAENLYLHPSYLMHLFKEETGYTVGKYISEKRLFLANQLISSGKSITEACYQSGYNNYSTFYNAYKQRYGTSPKLTNKKLRN